uniref:receptor kinase-like protein Xa21 n=1 Tax=Erigeron canadensis TaxID=72917 RepID=UPI001CB8C65C|nr:receptor kinase-like protein Xa21 [Erigeron canadensis]
MVVPKMNSKQPLWYSSFYSHTFHLFSLVIFLTMIPTCTSDGNETDHLALLSFKSMITQDPYGALSSWNASSHFCNWNGVTCGNRHKRVTRLRLWSQGLTGYLSPHIGNLSFLSILVIYNNSFRGNIPPELGRLSRLSLLNLYDNQFEGVIPTNLSGCSNLDTLVISANKLVGTIPKEIGFLTKLKDIVIDENNLTGGIPPFLGNLTLIESFSASRNPLDGNIPDTLGNWKRLKELYIGVCDLAGNIPYSIFNLSSLTDISMAENQLTGSLPSTIGATLPNLMRLQLSNNNLTGLLPVSISNCSKLGFIEISNTYLSGKLDVDFSKLTDLYQITLEGNLLGSGESDEMKFIETMKNCSMLQIIALGYCRFNGLLPISIGNLSNQLYYLDFTGNQLYGNLPSSIGNLVGLTNLNLGVNRFTGNIPSTIGKLQNLRVLAMYENQLSGSIPDPIGNLTLLLRLILRSNRFEGKIPSSIGNCLNLLQISLSDNRLTEEIPKQLLQLSSLSGILNLSHNNLLGSLPSEVGDLKKLSNLDLSHNSLSGNIPNSLSGCTNLFYLSLKGNLFQGMIPPSLSSLRGLALLDLSQNNLSGQIPKFLERFSLVYLDLSSNDFEGEVPVVGVFANESAFSIVGNSRLCGGLVQLGLRKCKETRKRRKKNKPLIVIIIVVASILFILFLCFLYAWFKKKSKGQESQSLHSLDQSSHSSLMNAQFLKVSYSQLLEATNGFSEDNLIGKGGFSSVYKGTLDVDVGFKYVAIKVLHLEIRGAHKSFIAECEVLSSIRHRNLLKIITLCSSVDFQGNDFKALVYEFMPNGSLHDWLHSSKGKRGLDLLQRINILIDVACALDYLHKQCVTTIVHGDLKPSNILLDDDMVAHVGDFGLAKFLGTNSHQNKESLGIEGTIGYAPPEYGMGSEMTSSGDVYSFGILLLEVVTGKRPTDENFNDGVNLHQFAYMALTNGVNDVVDGNLLNFHQEDTIDAIAIKNKVAKAKVIEDCLALTIKIGVSCSMDFPSRRMDIKVVVHELQRIQHALNNI